MNLNFSLQWLIDDLYKQIRELLSKKMSDSLDETVISFLEDRDDLAFHLGKCDGLRDAWSDIQTLLDDRKQRLAEEENDGFETVRED